MQAAIDASNQSESKKAALLRLRPASCSEDPVFAAKQQAVQALQQPGSKLKLIHEEDPSSPALVAVMT